MAQNITIAGASYSDVPAIEIPKVGGGTARFIDEASAGGTTVISIDNGDGTQSMRITDNGSAITLKAKSITANGTYLPASDNADGYNSVTVNVPSPTINLQNKTVTENGTVNADSGYDGLGTVTVNVSSGGGKSFVAADNMIRRNTSSLSASGLTVTCPKTGTYTIRWFAYRSSTSGTNSTRVYVGGSAVGTENQTWDVNSNGQKNKLTGISMTQGQTVEVYARARSSSYYVWVMGLSIEEE